MKKYILKRILFLREKKTRSTRKKRYCESIRINTSKEGDDENYETGWIQTFISKFKDRNVKIKGISRCVKCLAHKSFFDKVKDKYKLHTIVSILNWLNLIQKSMLTYCLKCRKKLNI